MAILVVIAHVFVCVFLIAVILLQAGRGQGLSWGVFGGTPQSILGTKTASFLSRVTTICASLFLVTCIGLNIIETHRSRSLFNSPKASQIDLSKIKKALEEAQKNSAAPGKSAEKVSVAPENPAEKMVQAVAPKPTETKTQTPIPVIPIIPEQKKS